MTKSPWTRGSDGVARKPENRQCIICGVTFHRGLDSKASFEKRKSCSRVCQGIARKRDTAIRKEIAARTPSNNPEDTKLCGQCNQPFHKGSLHRSSWNMRKYCGKACLSDARKAGKIAHQFKRSTLD